MLTGVGRPRAAGMLVAAVAVATVVVVALVVWTGAEEGAGAEGPPSHAYHLQVDGGRGGEVAVQYVDELRVWWREAGETTWSAPARPDTADGRYLGFVNVRTAGSTVAIRAPYDSVAPWDDETDETNVETDVFVVCVEGSCTASDHYEDLQQPPCRRGSCLLSRPESKGVSQVPELSEDGQQVYFGSTERGYVVWTAEAGLREVQPEGVPEDAVAGAPMLAPDGSLRLVVGRHEDGHCRLTLLTTDPVGGATSTIRYSEQATTTVPTSTGDCGSTLDAFTGDQVLAHTDRDVPAYFARTGEAWAPVDEDPTGLVRFQPIAGRHAEGSQERSGYWHGREVVVGSPDGRRLVAQVHFPGEVTWSDPVTVATAPRGLDCFEIAPTSTPGADPFYVSMRCRYRPTAHARMTYVGVHAVTSDGVTWASTFGDDLPTRVGDGLSFGGDPAHRWTPEDGMTRVP